MSRTRQGKRSVPGFSRSVPECPHVPKPRKTECSRSVPGVFQECSIGFHVSHTDCNKEEVNKQVFAPLCQGTAGPLRTSFFSATCSPRSAGSAVSAVHGARGARARARGARRALVGRAWGVSVARGAQAARELRVRGVYQVRARRARGEEKEVQVEGDNNNYFKLLSQNKRKGTPEKYKRNSSRSDQTGNGFLLYFYFVKFSILRQETHKARMCKKCCTSHFMQVCRTAAHQEQKHVRACLPLL